MEEEVDGTKNHHRGLAVAIYLLFMGTVDVQSGEGAIPERACRQVAKPRLKK
jgi:hypothetical protein